MPRLLAIATQPNATVCMGTFALRHCDGYGVPMLVRGRKVDECELNGGATPKQPEPTQAASVQVKRVPMANGCYLSEKNTLNSR